MTLKQPEPPKLNADLSLWDNAVAFEDGLSQALITELELTKRELKSVVIDQCKLDRNSFSYVKLRKLEISDSLITACAFLACDLADSIWIRVRALSSRLTGLDLSNGVFRDVSFEGCKLDESNWRMSKLTRCKFVDCDLTEADFYGCSLSNVTFQSCYLTRAQFSGCKVSGLDLRGCEVAGLNGLLSLGGATIDQNQAVSLGSSLLRELGIQIEES